MRNSQITDPRVMTTQEATYYVKLIEDALSDIAQRATLCRFYIFEWEQIRVTDAFAESFRLGEVLNLDPRNPELDRTVLLAIHAAICSFANLELEEGDPSPQVGVQFIDTEDGISLAEHYVKWLHLVAGGEISDARLAAICPCVAAVVAHWQIGRSAGSPTGPVEMLFVKQRETFKLHALMIRCAASALWKYMERYPYIPGK